MLLNIYKSIILYLFLLLQFNNLHSQELRVFNSETKEIIPFVTVTLSNNNKQIYGGYCDDKGRLKISENILFDTANFSCLGYESVSVKKENLIFEKVSLNPIITLLDEVVISNGNKKSSLIGSLNEKKYSYINLNTENQTALFFDNSFTKKVGVSSFLFKVNKIKNKTAIRIHLYNKKNYKQFYFDPNDNLHKERFYESYIPDDDIININIIEFLEPNQNGIIEIDLSTYAIEMPIDGIFVAIECLAYYDINGNILKENYKPTKIETHITKSNNYCTKYSLLNDKWLNINQTLKNDYENIFNTEINKKNLIAPSFGLKIFELKDEK